LMIAGSNTGFSPIEFILSYLSWQTRRVFLV
jgi:hypothetical protein